MKNLSRISIPAAAAGAVVAIAATATLTVTLSMALTACGPKGPTGIPVLDVTASYPAKNIVLQDIADVEYIPLETREGFLLSWINIHFMDDEYIVMSNNVGDIMFFDRHTGKGIKTFNRTGRGPGEYTGVYGLAVDRKNNQMFVTPNSTSGYPYPMYVYDMEGKPLRTVVLKRDITFPAFMHNYDEGHLFYHTGYSTPEPMGLLSKTDTLVTYLPVRLEGRESMTVSIRIENGMRGQGAGESIARTRDGIMLSEPGLDTMWRWRSATGELVPVMTRTPSWSAMGEYPVGVFFKAENDDYIFLNTIEKRYDFETNEGFDHVNLILDKRTGEFFEGGLVNADFTERWPFSPEIMTGVPADLLVSHIDAFRLIDLHAEGKLTGRLAEVAATLKEDDNPVMMIATFKH